MAWVPVERMSVSLQLLSSLDFWLAPQGNNEAIQRARPHGLAPLWENNYPGVMQGEFLLCLSVDGHRNDC